MLKHDYLYEASGRANEFGRRIRELRDEEGMNIVTHKDRSDLKPGEYMLVDTKLRKVEKRNISARTRAEVFARDGSICQMCGAEAGTTHPANGRRVTLQLGHIVDKSMGGSDDANNLRVLCSVCNEGASNITVHPPDFAKLLAMVKKAPNSDQRELLEWLKKKFSVK